MLRDLLGVTQPVSCRARIQVQVSLPPKSVLWVARVLTEPDSLQVPEDTEMNRAHAQGSARNGTGENSVQRPLCVQQIRGLWQFCGDHGEGPRANRLPRQENGELCLNSAQCKSKCCRHDALLSLARCEPKASENSECSPKTLYGVYKKCPCERGLTCEGDKTIVGSITNTNFGICNDAGRSRE